VHIKNRLRIVLNIYIVSYKDLETVVHIKNISSNAEDAEESPNPLLFEHPEFYGWPLV